MSGRFSHFQPGVLALSMLSTIPIFERRLTTMTAERREPDDDNLDAAQRGDRSSTAGGDYGTPGSTFSNPLTDSGSGEGGGGPDPGDDDAYLEQNFPVV